ncbi:acyltransferase [Flavilitoribacter nigricans]|uniref:N-acetyltransferase n=1 Tax=Flavilitoribacter nigricans (strain ATCC 23147 / DSM 23189 / NBRC 102662 / NCIMB 1420 / SS-2) TaxID=1122177 RepID=A0A2D0MZB4_FLAN2|nr:acyltransferase [Flavilitoribacter nigricans]PHN01510.1 N-acetyltransferase [Flavilitoribacter nigricans DSM 23189 = NBRC 102662]
MQGTTYFAHPTAVIDPGARIGAGTRIWHFCHIMEGAIIGANCSLGQNVFVASGVEIGRGTKVQNNVSIYTGVICEEDVFLGPSVVFTNVRNPRSAISRKEAYQKTLVRRGATIGANATVICGNQIGRYAFIGAGSVITKDVPDYALMVGNPARQTGWMSDNGQRLDFDTEGKGICSESGDHYTLENGAVRKLEH